MSRVSSPFRPRHLTAAVKAVIAAGREVARAEIDPATGKIVIVIVGAIIGRLEAEPQEELDRELAEFEVRHGQG
jgi:hypothetical protein